MMVIVRWIIALPLTVAAVLFALAHRDPVSITWSPFDPAVELPLYVVALSFMGAGFFIGALVAWIGMGHVRHDRRQQRKIIKTLEKELQEANDKECTDRPLVSPPTLPGVANG